MKPLPSSEGKKEDGQVFLTGAQISEALLKNEPVKILVVQEGTECKANLPDILKHLLTEYQVHMPEEIPCGLPAVRGIQHRIELVPG